MIKVTDLKEAKAERSGKTTPKMVLKELLEESEHIDEIVCVVKTKDGIIYTTTSYMNQVTAIGMLSCGEQQIFNDIRE